MYIFFRCLLQPRFRGLSPRQARYSGPVPHRHAYVSRLPHCHAYVTAREKSPVK